jgi:hypothetical protein
MRNFFGSLRGTLRLIGQAFRYKLIVGASTVKLIQVVLQLTRHQPWTPDQSEAAGLLIDVVVGLAILHATGQAHESNPGQ